MTEDIPPNEDIDRAFEDVDIVHIERLSETDLFISIDECRLWIECRDEGLFVRTDNGNEQDLEFDEEEVESILDDIDVDEALENSTDGEDVKEMSERNVIDGVDLDEHMDDLIDADFVDDNIGRYWDIEKEHEYIETWEEGDEVVAKDNRHELSCYGASEEEAMNILQESIIEFLIRK